MDEAYNLQFATTQLDLRQYLPAKNHPWTQYQDQTGMKVVKSTEYQY